MDKLAVTVGKQEHHINGQLLALQDVGGLEGHRAEREVEGAFLQRSWAVNVSIGAGWMGVGNTLPPEVDAHGVSQAEVDFMRWQCGFEGLVRTGAVVAVGADYDIEAETRSATDMNNLEATHTQGNPFCCFPMVVPIMHIKQRLIHTKDIIELIIRER